MRKKYLLKSFDANVDDMYVHAGSIEKILEKYNHNYRIQEDNMAHADGSRSISVPSKLYERIGDIFPDKSRRESVQYLLDNYEEYKKVIEENRQLRERNMELSRVVALATQRILEN